MFAYLKAQLASGDPIRYPALVTDVRSFGFFVDVTGLAMSGLVPLALVEEDYFVFNEARRNLVGRRTRRVISLGDKVTVQVAVVDSVKKQVDFRLAKAAPVRARAGSGQAATEDCGIRTFRRGSSTPPESSAEKIKWRRGRAFNFTASATRERELVVRYRWVS